MEDLPTMPLELDAADPVVVALAWGLTMLVGWLVKDRGKASRIRHLLPAVAVILAVALRAAADAMSGQDLSWPILIQAGGAAGVAVLGHSQWRELLKLGAVLAERKPEADTDPGHSER